MKRTLPVKTSVILPLLALEKRSRPGFRQGGSGPP
jgi:hypothetical protein